MGVGWVVEMEVGLWWVRGSGRWLCGVGWWGIGLGFGG